MGQPAEHDVAHRGDLPPDSLVEVWMTVPMDGAPPRGHRIDEPASIGGRETDAFGGVDEQDGGRRRYRAVRMPDVLAVGVEQRVDGRAWRRAERGVGHGASRLSPTSANLLIRRPATGVRQGPSRVVAIDWRAVTSPPEVLDVARAQVLEGGRGLARAPARGDPSAAGCGAARPAGPGARGADEVVRPRRRGRGNRVAEDGWLSRGLPLLFAVRAVRLSGSGGLARHTAAGARPRGRPRRPAPRSSASLPRYAVPTTGCWPRSRPG